MTATELIEHIELTIQTSLGGDFSKLSHVNDISKNKFKNEPNRFGVLIKPSTENSQVVGQFFVDQDIEVILTNQYSSSKIVSDLDQRTKAIILADKSKTLYKAIAIAPIEGLRQVKDLSIDEPEYNNESHTVIQRFSFVMTYK